MSERPPGAHAINKATARSTLCTLTTQVHSVYDLATWWKKLPLCGISLSSDLTTAQLQLRFRLHPPPPIMPHVEAGDFLLWDSRIVHCSSPAIDADRFPQALTEADRSFVLPPVTRLSPEQDALVG